VAGNGFQCELTAFSMSVGRDSARLSTQAAQPKPRIHPQSQCHGSGAAHYTTRPMGRLRFAAPKGAAHYTSTAKLRVTDGSTGIPGPIVVDTVTFFRYRPFDDDGLTRNTSSSAAP
jgi:hypothetical protein